LSLRAPCELSQSELSQSELSQSELSQSELSQSEISKKLLNWVQGELCNGGEYRSYTPGGLFGSCQVLLPILS